MGNPLVKERVEAANELTRYLALQRKTIETHIELEQELSDLPRKLSYQKDLIKKCEADITFYQTNRRVYDKAERKALREDLFSEMKDNILMQTERQMLTYQRFEIILPANMTAVKPFVWLQKNGRYYVELSDSEVGGLVRIDNYLDNLPAHLNTLKERHRYLTSRRTAIRNELANKQDYTDQIEKMKQRIAAIDEELGVNVK